MDSEDLLISRLNLLIIMSKAYLKGFPIGNFRKDTISKNARYVFSQARAASRSTEAHPHHSASSVDRHFLQRVQLLAIMLNAFIENKSEGRFRTKAMAENIDHLCKDLADGFQLGDANFLKVA